MEQSHESSQQGDPDAGAGSSPKDYAYTGSSNSGPTTPLAEPGQAEVHAAAARKEKGRVRFNSNAALTQRPVGGHLVIPSPERSPSPARLIRPSALRAGSSGSVPTLQQFQQESLDASEKSISAAAAHERARQIADKLQRNSPRASIESNEHVNIDQAHESDIPLQNLSIYPHQTADNGHQSYGDSQSALEESQYLQEEAQSLVRSHTRAYRDNPTTHLHTNKDNGEGSSSHVVPSDTNGGIYDGVYTVPPPEEYRGGVLSQLLRLYKSTENHLGGGTNHMGHRRHRSTSSTGPHTPGSESGTTTPSRKKWYEQNKSQDTLANLIEASARLANPALGHQSKHETETDKKHAKKRPGYKRTNSAARLSAYWQKEEARITVHIAETLARQGYIIKLCRALMLFGAPTHRLEEYLTMTARVLEIEGQFLYLPGCMIISFDDKSTHTTEVRIVRLVQGIDLGKLKDVHHIYKEVMHDVIGVEEGTERLEDLVNAKNKFSEWFRVLVFGFTSAMAAPFSFKARLIDLPIIFLFGCIVGLLQIIVAPRSNFYSNVFEVTATVLISFLARAFGSIRGGSLFCFSALAQSGIVMLLPGYAVLCSALELQSRAIVPGSIRIVYAIVYSLLIGFGITVGAALWGLFDAEATSKTTCDNPLDGELAFIFVPFFIICISILYQAKWRQMPMMIIIAFAGYVVNFFSGRKFSASPQIANTLGALCVGVLANLYSRIRHGVAAATLIPAIFVQVPGGLASTGGLLSGLQTANLLTNSKNNGTTTPANSTSQFNGGQLSSVVFDVAASMVQIAIGIAVGLFISALVVYPLGKRRSGLFSF